MFCITEKATYVSSFSYTQCINLALAAKAECRNCLQIANQHVHPLEGVLKHWHSSSIIEKTWDSHYLSLLIPSLCLYYKSWWMDNLYIEGLAGSLRTSSYLAPVLTEIEGLFKEDDSPNCHINRLHCGDQYYQVDWMQGERISGTPYVHVYSVSLWDENNWRKYVF